MSTCLVQLSVNGRCYLHEYRLGRCYLGLDEKEPVKKLLELSAGSCLKFVEILCNRCPCFNDVALYKPLGKTVAFHKRAQLCASMLHSDGIVAFKDIDAL